MTGEMLAYIRWIPRGDEMGNARRDAKDFLRGYDRGDVSRYERDSLEEMR